MLLYRILTVLVIAPLFFWVNLYASDAWFNLLLAGAGGAGRT